MNQKFSRGTFNVKVVLFVLILTIAAVAVVAGIYHWLKVPKSGWKTFSGCVVTQNKNVNFQFMGKNEWQAVGKDMGCGHKYSSAQSWGLKNQKINGQNLDIALISVLVQSSKPASFDQNSKAYFQIPASNNYLELQRITADFGKQKFQISDTEWQYLKNSFKIVD